MKHWSNAQRQAVFALEPRLSDEAAVVASRLWTFGVAGTSYLLSKRGVEVSRSGADTTRSLKPTVHAMYSFLLGQAELRGYYVFRAGGRSRGDWPPSTFLKHDRSRDAEIQALRFFSAWCRTEGTLTLTCSGVPCLSCVRSIAVFVARSKLRLIISF